ncbi:hypothetical protein GPALN_010723 [Globodera pallida]|nr:hypothetical protein GPALN_010723 [Globodera pallida]
MKIFVVNTAIFIFLEILILKKLGGLCVGTNNKRPRIIYISEPQVHHVAPREFRDFVIRMTTDRRWKEKNARTLPSTSVVPQYSAVPNLINFETPNQQHFSALPNLNAPNFPTIQNIYNNNSDMTNLPAVPKLSDQATMPKDQFAKPNLTDQSAAVLNPSDQLAVATQSDHSAKLDEFYQMENHFDQFGTQILSDQSAIASQSDQFAIEDQSDQPRMPNNANVQAMANIASSSAIPNLSDIQQFPNYPIFRPPQPDHLAMQNLSKLGRMPEWLSHSRNPSINSIASLTQSKQQPLAYNLSFETNLPSLTVPDQQKKNWTSEANMQGHKRPTDKTEHYITASSEVNNEKDQTESKRVYDIRRIFERSLSALGILPIYINKPLTYVIKELIKMRNKA